MSGDIGNINISAKVLKEIVSYNLSKYKEVKLYPKKGIKCEIKGERVVVNLMIKVVFGVWIPDLMWNIQRTIKEEIERLTHFKVNEVNIHIQEFEFPENVA